MLRVLELRSGIASQKRHRSSSTKVNGLPCHAETKKDVINSANVQSDALRQVVALFVDRFPLGSLRRALGADAVRVGYVIDEKDGKVSRMRISLDNHFELVFSCDPSLPRIDQNTLAARAVQKYGKQKLVSQLIAITAK